AGKSGCGILLEPFGRNTAPALTLAALYAVDNHQDPLLLVMPADHVISDIDAFHTAVRQGIPAAQGGSMVTFGIVPVRPETGYGYLRQGERQDDGSYELEAFAEKPDVDTAKRYLESGQYLWNSGLFMMRASIWLKAIQFFNPDIFRSCTAAMSSSSTDIDFVRIDPDAFDACPTDSLDYA